jgi:hypothetical protein
MRQPTVMCERRAGEDTPVSLDGHPGPRHPAARHHDCGAVPVRDPAAHPIVVQLLSREPPASELTHRDVHVVRRYPVQMRVQQPHTSRVTRLPDIGPARASCADRQALRPMLAEPSQPRWQRQLATVEHTDVPAIRPVGVWLGWRWWPELALVGQSFARNVRVVGRPGVLARCYVGGVHPCGAQQRAV